MRRWVILIPSREIGGPVQSVTGRAGDFPETGDERPYVYIDRDAVVRDARRLWKSSPYIREVGTQPIVVEMEGERLILGGTST